MNNGKICANCKYNIYNAKDGVFYCGSKNSDNYGCCVAYDDSCEDFEVGS